MKQRKAPKAQPKRVTLGQGHAQAAPIVDNSNKQPSGHTKMSTNYTIHSSAFQQARRQKKNAARSGSKENPSTSTHRQPHSKNNKKIKINLQQDKQAQLQPAQQSYRQYCLVDENFVPVVNADDQKRLNDMLSQTATTSCDFNYLRSPTRQYTAAQPSKLRKRAISNSSSHSSNHQENISQRQVELAKIEKIDVAISARQALPERTSIEISAVVESNDIGLQYSARPEEEKPPIPQKKEELKVVQSESLSDLLFKLQFSHLGDEKSFSSLTSNEKEHFSQLLETLVSKLKVKPQIKPISFPDLSVPPPRCKEEPPNYEELERQVCLREYRQMNWMEAASEENEDAVNTSLYSVVSFLCHLFCFVEMHYSDQFVYMIQKIYGHTYREKYRRITRRIPLIPDRKFRVVEDPIFLEFINESSNYNSSHELSHLKAIFDAFNEHLEEYRPFFLGNGEQFPWAMRMFVSMSEYSISEDSLQIIFLQAKEKMVEWCSMLCGLLPDHHEKVLLPGNPLELKRNEREDKMVLSWLREDNFEKDGIELYSTQALHDTAEIIYQQLLAQCAADLLGTI